LKIDDKTALRVGWARFVTPTEMLQNPSGIYSGGGGDWLSAPCMGYGTVQNPLAPINHRFFRSVSLFFIQLSAPISK
jgi:hypothetical protein